MPPAPGAAGVRFWEVALGYKNLYWYRGGASAWNQARLPVVRTNLLKQL